MQLSNEFWAAIEPVTNRAFLGEDRYKVAPQWNDIFNEGTDDEAQRSFTEYGAVPSLQVKTEGAAAQTNQVKQGKTKTHFPLVYAGAVAFSHEAAQDTRNRYGKITTGMGALGKAVKVTPELVCADYLDNAFNSARPATADGVELCGTHILPDGIVTSANELATPAAMDEAATEDVMVALKGILGPSGMIQPSRVKAWIVPSALYPIAKKLALSDKTVGTANNDPSIVKGTTVKEFDYLTSSTRWFAETEHNDKNGLFWDWLEKTKLLEDTNILLLQKIFMAYFRARIGCGDWRAIFGSAAT